MTKQFIRPPGVYNPPSLSPAVRAGDTIYLPGQVAHDTKGSVVGVGDIVELTSRSRKTSSLWTPRTAIESMLLAEPELSFPCVSDVVATDSL